MDTRIDEIGDEIFRISTFVPDVGPTGFTFNQFLIRAAEPLLFHCGQRMFFPTVSAALASVLPLDRLRWISFGHIEADECGAVNLWLEAAPNAQVVYSELGCQISVGDLADRPPRALPAGETLDLGGRRVRLVPTPHVPHGWEAQVLYEEVTSTLFCGDLFTHVGKRDPLTQEDLVAVALQAEQMFGATGVTPSTAITLRMLAELKPRRLALMHGSSFEGDGAGQLLKLADGYDALLDASMSARTKAAPA